MARISYFKYFSDRLVTKPILWSQAGGANIVTESRSRCSTGSAAPEAEIVFFVCVLSADLKKLTTIFLNDL